MAVPDGGKIRIGIGRDGSNQEVQKRKEKEKKTCIRIHLKYYISWISDAWVWFIQ